MQTVAVIGLGQVGTGLAQICAAAGLETIVRERDAHLLWEGLARIDRRLSHLVQRGRLLSTAKRQLQERFIPVQTLWHGIERAELVIEAVTEDMETKRAIWRELAAHVPATTILATASTDFRATDIGAGLPHPERMIGLRFTDPVTALDLVEVVWTAGTDLQAVQAAIAFLQRIGKVPLCQPVGIAVDERLGITGGQPVGQAP